MPLAAITAGRIAEYREERSGQASLRRLGERVSPASVNADLGPLRHLLRLAHGEWEVLAAPPRIRLLRGPQGRLRWLAPAEEERLLTACLTHGGEALRLGPFPARRGKPCRRGWGSRTLPSTICATT